MDAYNDLLDATISHLHDLKRQGTRFVPVTLDLLKSLSTPAAQSTVRSVPAQPASRPVPPPRPTFAPPAESVAEPPIVFSKDISKLEAFEQLRERALVCQKCSNLVASRKNVVFGVGSIDAELMFIG